MWRENLSHVLFFWNMNFWADSTKQIGSILQILHLVLPSITIRWWNHLPSASSALWFLPLLRVQVTNILIVRHLLFTNEDMLYPSFILNPGQFSGLSFELRSKTTTRPSRGNSCLNFHVWFLIPPGFSHGLIIPVPLAAAAILFSHAPGWKANLCSYICYPVPVPSIPSWARCCNRVPKRKTFVSCRWELKSRSSPLSLSLSPSSSFCSSFRSPTRVLVNVVV